MKSFDHLNEGALRDLIAYDLQRIREAKERLLSAQRHLNDLEAEVGLLSQALKRRQA